MKTLAKQIATRLEERAFCVLFEDDLERFWPRKKIARSERKRKIRAFAESQSWAAAILEGEFGMSAIFRRAEPVTADQEGASVIPS
jgi:hypothetical protein